MQAPQSLKMLLFATIFVASGWSADAAEIELRPSAVASGTVVRLGDIAAIRHDDADVAAELHSLPLFPTPAAGKVRQVKQQELAQLLAFSDERLAGCRLTGAASVQIRTADAAESVATNNAASASPQRFVAQTAYRPATSRQNAVVKATHTQPVAPAAAAAPIAVAPGVVTPAEAVEAVVALRRLDRGEVIRPEDVDVRPVSAEQVESGSIQDLSAVVGREVTQAVQPNTPISAKMVQKPRLVRRGETVNVCSIAAGIRVTTSGKAREDGSEGSLVQVDLDGSNERIVARVVGLQQVEVYAGAPQVPTQKTLPTTSDKK